MAQTQPASPDIVASSARRASIISGGWAALKNWREPLFIFLGLRVGLGILAFFASVFIPAIARKSTGPYVVESFGRWGDRLLKAWSHWDGEWFLQIATVGYGGSNGTSAFFPLYPTLVRVVGWPLFGNVVLAGVLISAVCTATTLVLFWEVVRRDFGRDIANLATLYLAAFPTSFFLSTIYSESLFLSLTLGAFLAARHYRKWWLAGVLVALATLTRNLGITLILPLSWEWWQQHRGDNKFNWRSAAWLVVPPVTALAGWVVYNWLALGSPVDFMASQKQWNRDFGWPWQTVWNGIQIFFTPRQGEFLPPGYWEDENLINLPFFVLFVGLWGVAAWLCFRPKTSEASKNQAMPFSYLVFFAIGIIFPLFSPTAKVPLLSFPRLALVLFPAFIVLALFGARWRWLHYLYLFTALMLLALFFARYTNWYWVA